MKMNVSEAVAERFLELCAERNITVNKLATMSGVTQSTVNDIVNHKAKNIGIVTIKKLCDGLDMTISDFFDTERFRELEQELF
jgi:DNA-binding Xre family transcriptional regulator